MQRYRCDTEIGGGPDAQRLLLMSRFLIDYPFAERLYPGALDAIAHLGRFGPTVILSDGDVVFQPRKVQRSGLWDAVDGRVLIYMHKEQMLDAGASATIRPATTSWWTTSCRILAAMKADLGRAPDDGVPAPGPLRHSTRPTSPDTRPPTSRSSTSAICAAFDVAKLLAARRPAPAQPCKEKS